MTSALSRPPLPSAQLRWGADRGCGVRGRGELRLNSAPRPSSGKGIGAEGKCRAECESSRGGAIGRREFPWWGFRGRGSRGGREIARARSAYAEGFDEERGSEEVGSGGDAREGFADRRVRYGGRWSDAGNLVPDETDWEGERPAGTTESTRRAQSGGNSEGGAERAYGMPHGGGAGSLYSVGEGDGFYPREEVSAGTGGEESGRVFGRKDGDGFYEEGPRSRERKVRTPIGQLEVDEDGYDGQMMAESDVVERRRYEGSSPDGRDRAPADRREGLSRGRGYLKYGERASVDRRDGLRLKRALQGTNESREREFPHRNALSETDDQPSSSSLERKKADSDFRIEPEYTNVSSGREVSTNVDLEAVDQERNPAVANYFQDVEVDVSGIQSNPEEAGEFIRARDESGRDKVAIEKYWGEADPAVSTRGALYAKQVISQATALNLGVVSQLWVDMEKLKVVALDLRPNLLSGDFESMLLKDLGKVGDVILIYDENALLDDLNLFDCSCLVGSDILTENGFVLGKVRDYDFNLEDGALLSVEFDTFGVPLIPSTMISTYSLTADEIIEAQDDALLVRKGAERRVQKLTKGLFSRNFRGTSRSSKTAQRRKVPQRNSPRSSYVRAAETRNMARNMGQQNDRVRRREQLNRYSPERSRIPEQPERDTFYSTQTNRARNGSSGTTRLDSDQYENPDPEATSMPGNNYMTSERMEIDEVPSPAGVGDWQKDSSEVKRTTRTSQSLRGSPRRSTPEVTLKNRGLPMSY